jgi:hypothetical protein
MGIVRKVILGLENRAGCIFSLLAHLHIQNGGSKRIWILTYS